MGFFDFLRRRPKYAYTQNEVEALETYIEQQYGKIETVFHEIKSPDIHLDIYVVKPTEEEDYYKLISMGVGAYSMQVPEKMRNLGMDRAELVMYLPADWKIQSIQEVDYWPIRMMKTVGRVPVRNHTWIGEGHSFGSEDGMPYAENTRLNSCFLLCARNRAGEICSQLLPSGKKVRFYQIIPAYREEMDYKVQNGSQALVQKMNENSIPLVIDPQRKNVCK